ncbi:MAG: mechanosensitive ion channel family protein [Clostridiaceae bacterium]|nr:mechanosensitive ion channel family protein [Clostridiaceae bacterium]
MIRLFGLNTEAESLNIGKFSITMEEVNKFIGKLIHVAIIIILMFLIIKIGNALINKFVKRQVKSDARFSLDDKKAITLGAVMKSILKYTTYFIGAFSIISVFTNVSFGVAGVGGAAIVGLGAKDLVNDVINGFFILFENQYAVGDHVKIGTFSGIVESIGIRSTTIRDFSGALHIMRNGTVSEVTNFSRGNIRFTVDIEIPYEDDIDKAMKIIKRVSEKFEQENEEITEPIDVFGVNSLNPSGVTIRVYGRSKSLMQFRMEAKLRKILKEELEKEGIYAPYPKTELINK